MKKIITALFGLVVISTASMAQTAPVATPPTTSTTPAPVPAPEQKITIFGFVRNDVFLNSRKSLDLRDGALSIYPLDATNLPTKDATGTTLTNNLNDDNNAISQLGFSAIITRLGVKFAGVTAFGAKASGMLETDFFGISNGVAGTSGGGTENLLRLRHAYVSLDWEKTQLLVGQYWISNFIPKCFPATTAFSTGIPYNPFGFVPQVRLTQKLSPEISLMGMLYGYDIAGFSPAGAFQSGTGVDAAKYTGLPSFATQLGFENKKFLVTVGIEASTIRPRITDTQNPNTGVFGGTGTPNVIRNISTNLSTINFLAFAKLTAKNLTVKAYTNYGQSYTQYAGLGGLAEYRDVSSGAWKYVPQNQFNLWGELTVTKSKKYQPAIFVGYLQNMGLATPINKSSVSGATLSFLGRGINNARSFDNMLRIAPRFDIYSGKMKISLEYEYSNMLWADTDGTVMSSVGEAAQSTSFKAGTGQLARSFNAVNSRFGAVVVYNF